MEGFRATCLLSDRTSVRNANDRYSKAFSLQGFIQMFLSCFYSFQSNEGIPTGSCQEVLSELASVFGDMSKEWLEKGVKLPASKGNSNSFDNCYQLIFDSDTFSKLKLICMDADFISSH
jgi:hypothetical protein